MSAKIIPKKSVVSSKIPSSQDLENGEIAVNFADGIIFGKNPSDGTIVSLTGALELHTHQIGQITGLQDALNNKVNIVVGKGLSTEDYTTAEKQKLAGIAENATANLGTVTSISLTTPTGLNVSPLSITSSGTFQISYTEGYSIPTNAKQTNWDTAYSWGDHNSVGYALLSNLGSAAFKNAPVLGDASLDQVVLGNDSRLIDARTPLSHVHSASDITSGIISDSVLPTNIFRKDLDVLDGGNASSFQL